MMRIALLFFKRFGALALSNIAGAAIFSIALSMTGAVTLANAQSPVGAPGEPVLSINDWLLRMHDAAMKKRSYIGTLVQSSPQNISSARIWHTCDGAQQMERVETLTGAPRSTFRHNDKLVTFMPEAKLVRVEKREQIGGFPELLKPGVGSIPEFYSVKVLGAERIAGLDADVVQLVPKDALRFGYRIWTEKKSSLVLKLQTLDGGGAVLEQAAFSELQLDAPVKMEKLMQMMAATDGYKVDQAAITKTTASAEGWLMKLPVSGFKSLSCYKRGATSVQGNTGANAVSSTASQAESTFQWLFSDGLATVSLFVEDFDKTRHTQEGMIASGATHTLLKRMNEYWLTAVGEVPPQTLKNFAQNLERKR
jgi:sigma-E factor negative regulatory protein RseB